MYCHVHVILSINDNRNCQKLTEVNQKVINVCISHFHGHMQVLFDRLHVPENAKKVPVFPVLMLYFVMIIP